MLGLLPPRALAQPTEVQNTMTKKDDLKAELTKLGISFDEGASAKELEALLPADDAVLAEPEDASTEDEKNTAFVASTISNATNLPSGKVDAPAADSHDDIEVGDPQLLRPAELPLVIKPANNGTWKNDEQASYAATLNAAAYSYPERWKEVKDVEIARLKEIGINPDRFYFYTGTQKGATGVVSYKNKLID